MSRRYTPSSSAPPSTRGVARRCGADSKSWNAHLHSAFTRTTRRVFREGRSGAAHGFDLPRPKGVRPPCVDFSRSNSLLMLRSATKDSAAGLFVLPSASRLSGLLRRHPENSARTGSRRLPQFAERVSRSSPAQPQDRCPPCVGRPASPPVPLLFGSPPVALRLPAGLPKPVLSLAHRHLHV